MDHVDDMTLFLDRKLVPFGNTMPFFEASAAARCGRMLGDEDRVFAHRRLLAVIGGVGRCESLFDKVGGVSEDDVQALAVQVFSLGTLETESHAEWGSRKVIEDVVNISHASNSSKRPE
jgi:hypothetical protein